jgi:hypothetical protein
MGVRMVELRRVTTFHVEVASAAFVHSGLMTALRLQLADCPPHSRRFRWKAAGMPAGPQPSEAIRGF